MSSGRRLAFLRALRAVDAGAGVAIDASTMQNSRAASVAAAVLRGAPSAEPSAVIIAIARFLYGGLRGRIRRRFSIQPPGSDEFVEVLSMALSRDGATLFTIIYESCAMRAFRVADGTLLRVIGRSGSGPHEFYRPLHVFVAADDYIYVADCGNHRIQVLDPDLDFHALIPCSSPRGVCVTDEYIFVTTSPYSMSVLRLDDGEVYFRFSWPTDYSVYSAHLWLTRGFIGVRKPAGIELIRADFFSGIMNEAVDDIDVPFNDGPEIPGLKHLLDNNIAAVDDDCDEFVVGDGNSISVCDVRTRTVRCVELQRSRFDLRHGGATCIAAISAIAAQKRLAVAYDYTCGMCLVID